MLAPEESPTRPPPTVSSPAAWRALLGAIERCPAQPWQHLNSDEKAVLGVFAPLVAKACSDRPRTFAHLAQSLDGRIALPGGDAFWISGPADLDHTHALRAVACAVVVGAETVRRDNPRLTVRRVAGADPLRVVLDPRGSVGPQHHVCDGAADTLLLRGPRGAGRPTGHAREVVLAEQRFGMTAVMAVLAAEGCLRVFIEGGGVTVSRALAEGVLDRLHLVIAPVLLGQGRPGLTLDLGPTVADCPRPEVHRHILGGDVLFDLAFN